MATVDLGALTNASRVLSDIVQLSNAGDEWASEFVQENRHAGIDIPEAAGRKPERDRVSDVLHSHGVSGSWIDHFLIPEVAGHVANRAGVARVLLHGGKH